MNVQWTLDLFTFGKYFPKRKFSVSHTKKELHSSKRFFFFLPKILGKVTLYWSMYLCQLKFLLVSKAHGFFQLINWNNQLASWRATKCTYYEPRRTYWSGCWNDVYRHWRSICSKYELQLSPGNHLVQLPKPQY